ncbi:hypothetical protein BDV12DRAFT_186071 [Aspergillus spectabilis]
MVTALSSKPSAHVDRLAWKVQGLAKHKAPSDRVLIDLSGIPGSGKSTLGAAVAARINQIENADSKFAVCLPMDGYHLSRAQLAAMPDPATAIHPRGAAFTFDTEAFYRLVQSLQHPVTPSATIYAPSFDHTIKDPIADDIRISPSLDREPWDLAAALLDESWFIDVDRRIAQARLVKRHVASGTVPAVAAAEHRISSPGFLNADAIMGNRLPVQELFPGS